MEFSPEQQTRMDNTLRQFGRIAVTCPDPRGQHEVTDLATFGKTEHGAAIVNNLGELVEAGIAPERALDIATGGGAQKNAEGMYVDVTGNALNFEAENASLTESIEDQKKTLNPNLNLNPTS